MLFLQINRYRVIITLSYFQTLVNCTSCGKWKRGLILWILRMALCAILIITEIFQSILLSVTCIVYMWVKPPWSKVGFIKI